MLCVCVCALQKAHAETLASDMDEEPLTEEQKDDLKRIRLRKKQVRQKKSPGLGIIPRSE